MEHFTAEDKANQIHGFKATLNNPNVSQDAKQHAQDQLKVLGADKFDYESQVPDEQQKNPNNVAGGLKAATNNPNVSEAGKEEAGKKLQGL